MKITNAYMRKVGDELKKRFRESSNKDCVINIHMKSDNRTLIIEPIWCRMPSCAPNIDFADVFCTYVKLNGEGKVNLPFMNALSYEELVYNILTYAEYDMNDLKQENLYIYYDNKSPVPCDVDVVLHHSNQD